ncbi:hypothetical protein ACQUFY_00185 [Robbsia andropogonis]|uniref:hypothetical protein n=1 Tax=Robbsia andropogonis TaxID=28092 RepID=UPI003D1CAD31
MHTIDAKSDFSEDDLTDTKALAAHNAELAQAQPNPIPKAEWEDGSDGKGLFDPVKNAVMPAKSKI